MSLGDAGRAEAARLAERLKREALAAVYSSPLERARETAEPIAAAAGVAPRIAEDLDELDYGDWSSRSFDDLRGDAAWAAWNADRAHRRPPSGESLLELQGRMARWLDRVRERHPGRRVAAVSHGEPIKAALLWVLGAPLDALARFEVGPASISVVVAGEWGFKVHGSRMTAYSQEEIRARVAALGAWFHNLDLNGVQTAPDHYLNDYPEVKWRRFAHAVPRDLSGWTVLDIGCNAGFYSLEMKRRGADRVVGVDSDERYLAQARFAAEVTGRDIEFRKLSVYDVALLGERFDLVLFMGVLYHLRHPLLALDLIHEHVVGDLLIFQCMQRGSTEVDPVAEDYDFFEEEHFDRPGYPKLHFIEHRYAGDPTNWWAPNAAAARAMLRSAGFEILSRPEEEVYVCRRAERPTAAGAVYPARPRRDGEGGGAA